MPKSAKKPATASTAALRLLQSPRRRTADDPKSKKADPGSKQSRVIAMLQSPAGATIAAMMKATGWQQHSVRGFLAGVVRKKLKLKLNSEKIDGNRVYRIDRHGTAQVRSLADPSAAPPDACRASRSVRHRRTARHSTSRLRVCAISTSARFGPVGTPCSGGGRPLTCPGICCFVFWPIGFRPIVWVIWMPRAGGCSIGAGSPEDAGKRAVDLEPTDR